MRGNKSVLQEALTGHFRDHRGWLLAMMCGRVDALTGQIEALTARIGEAIAPFAAPVAPLGEIPGAGRTGAQELIAGIGVDLTRFPTAGHRVWWARYAPPARQCAGKNKHSSTGKGSPGLAGTLGEAGLGAARAKTFPGSRYHRLARRRGKQRALVAAGNSPLVTAWHLLADPAARCTDLGPDWPDRLAPIRRKRQLIAELERLSGKKVTLQDAAARHDPATPATSNPALLRSAGCCRPPTWAPIFDAASPYSRGPGPLAVRDALALARGSAVTPGLVRADPRPPVVSVAH